MHRKMLTLSCTSPGYDYEDYYRRAPTHHYDRQYYDYYYGNYSQAGGYYDEQGYYHTDPR